MGAPTRDKGSILSALIGRPESLPIDLGVRFPELTAVRWRRGGLPPRVGGWLLGRASVSGITLWNTVWLGERARFDSQLLLHEFFGTWLSFNRAGPFRILYLCGKSARHGYPQNRFEVDAREYAAARLAQSEHTHAERTEAWSDTPQPRLLP